MNIFNDMFLDEDSFNITNMNNNLFNPYEGYMYGNMYKNLYKPYKNYKPSRLIPNNEQAELLLNINQIAFTNQDIRLYLDIYPDNKEMISIYNENNNLLNNLINDYESKYGPIMCESLSNSNLFSWSTTSFPWNEVNN